MRGLPQNKCEIMPFTTCLILGKFENNKPPAEIWVLSKQAHYNVVAVKKKASNTCILAHLKIFTETQSTAELCLWSSGRDIINRAWDSFAYWLIDMPTFLRRLKYGTIYKLSYDRSPKVIHSEILNFYVMIRVAFPPHRIQCKQVMLTH